MSTTIVTALYDIGRDELREKWGHRPFSEYLQWFKYLLEINCPMIIYIPQELESYIIEHRSGQTKVIIRDFTSLKAHKYRDQIQTVIDRVQPQLEGDCGRCPEFITANYETIIFSKFDFLKESTEINPFNSKYFLWLDAGTFYNRAPFAHEHPWPDPYKIRLLDHDQFLIAHFSDKIDINNREILEEQETFILKNHNLICAYMMGGTALAINRVHHHFWSKVEWLLARNSISNEQNILHLLYLEHPNLFYLYYNTKKNYNHLPEPLCYRMIPYELAVGTKSGVPYSQNKQIKVLGVATSEIGEDRLQCWLKTAQYYGYNYSLLGRDQKWESFNTKLQLFYQELQTVTQKYSIICDTTDAFFTGPSDEMYDRAQQFNQIVVSGEDCMAYPHGRNDPGKVRSYFDGIANGETVRYPNTGFIMGETKQLLRYLEMELHHPDDQGACFDTIYEQKNNIIVDYGTVLCGNIPNYPERHEAYSRFVFNNKTKRYYNKSNGQTPCFLHFPGRNWFYMRKYYNHSFYMIEEKTEEDLNSAYVVILIIMFIILLVLIYYLYFD